MKHCDKTRQNSEVASRYDVSKSEVDLGYNPHYETIQDSMANSQRISSLTLSSDSGFRELTLQGTGTTDSVPHHVEKATSVSYSNQERDATEYSDVDETEDSRFKMGTLVVDCDEIEDTRGKLQEAQLKVSGSPYPKNRSSSLEENEKCDLGKDEIAIGFVNVTDYELDARVLESS